MIRVWMLPKIQALECSWTKLKAKSVVFYSSWGALICPSQRLIFDQENTNKSCISDHTCLQSQSVWWRCLLWPHSRHWMRRPRLRPPPIGGRAQGWATEPFSGISRSGHYLISIMLTFQNRGLVKKKCVFNKLTIKRLRHLLLTVSWGTCAPSSAAHPMRVKGPWRALCLLKIPSKSGDEGVAGRNRRGKYSIRPV